MTLSMGRTPSSKREQILVAAELALLEKGVTATSIEEIAAEVGISKNGFFYHFRNKDELVRGVLERNLKLDEEWLDGLFAQADRTTNDPLISFLTFIDLLARDAESLPDFHPGCITSVCCYQERWLSNEVGEAAARVLLFWRDRLLERLQLIAKVHQPKIDADLEDLAIMLTALLDGTITYSKVVKQKEVLARQVRLYGELVERAFSHRR